MRLLKVLGVLLVLLVMGCGGNAPDLANRGPEHVAQLSAAVTGGPAITSPVDGSTLTGSSQTVTWSGTADQFALWVGSSLGGYDIWSGGPFGSAVSSTNVTGLPTNASTVYFRFWYSIAGNWTSEDTSYTAFTSTASPPSITSPVSGSTLTGATQTVTWSGTADQFALWVGSSVGGYDVWSGGPFGSGVSSADVTGLPTNGSPVYVRFWYSIAGSWASVDTSYTAWTQPPTITSPVSGSTLTGATQTVNWSGAADQFALWVGSSLGGYDLWSGGPFASNVSSASVSGLPTNGSTVYFRFWYSIGGNWTSEDTSYTAYQSTSTAPVITSPVNGSTLLSTTQTVTWSGSADEIALWVGSTPGGYDIWSGGPLSGSSASVTGLPSNGSTVYFRFWYLFGSTWTSQDSSYTSCSGAACQ